MECVCISFVFFVMKQVRKDIEMENLANSYLHEIIKQECWDAMSVKGRSVKVR